MNISLEKLSSETQRLIRGLEVLKQKLDKTSEPETAEDRDIFSTEIDADPASEIAMIRGSYDNIGITIAVIRFFLTPLHASRTATT